MVLGLFTECLGPGGIQRVNVHAGAVLASLSQQRGLGYRLLSLNDPPGYHSLAVDGFTFVIQGFGRDKRRFSLSAVGRIPRASMTYIGHPHLASLGLLIRLLNPRMRYWVAIYGIDAWTPLSLLKRLGLRAADGITSVCQYTATKAVEAQRVDASKVTILPPAVPESVIRARNGIRQPLSIALSGRILLTVGRMSAIEQYKGMDTVIRALPKILRSVPDTYYYLVGDGDDRDRLEHLALEIGVKDHVVFVGRVADDLGSYYRSCDIFVMPSREEGLSLVYIEAMAWGKPVVAGNHGGTPEIVLDGETGYLVQSGDVEAVAHRVTELLGDQQLRNAMGRAGRRRVEANYTFDRFRQRLVQLVTGNPVKSSA